MNEAAQPSDFARYTGDDKESRLIRKEVEATANAKNEKEYFSAIAKYYLG
jgi:hypothetical protein